MTTEVALVVAESEVAVVVFPRTTVVTVAVVPRFFEMVAPVGQSSQQLPGVVGSLAPVAQVVMAVEPLVAQVPLDQRVPVATILDQYCPKAAHKQVQVSEVTYGTDNNRMEAVPMGLAVRTTVKVEQVAVETCLVTKREAEAVVEAVVVTTAVVVAAVATQPSLDLWVAEVDPATCTAG